MRSAASKVYFRELLIDVNMPLRLVPRPFTAAIIAIEIPAAIRPYSMAVAPVLSRQKLKTKFLICFALIKFSKLVLANAAALPIPLPSGGELRTLRDAGHYVAALSNADQSKPQWQTAAHELMMAAEPSGILMLAEIAMRQALAHGRPKPPPTPRGKTAKKYRIVP